MPVLALALVLTAAALHAGWNIAVKESGDRIVSSWSIVAVGAVLGSPLLLFRDLPAEVLPNLLASAVFEIGYLYTLAVGYERGDLSVVYPIARGVGVAATALLGAIFLGDVLGPLATLAVGLVVAGIVGTAAGGNGWQRAVATGLCISCYSVIDAQAVRRLDDPIAYVVALFVFAATGYLPIVVKRRGWAGFRKAVAADWRRNTGVGITAITAYGLVLAAARIAPVGLVSAGREVSVVLGVLAGRFILKETVGPRRFVSAGLVAAGVILMALS